jgi:hypothetical protein
MASYDNLVKCSCRLHYISDGANGHFALHGPDLERHTDTVCFDSEGQATTLQCSCGQEYIPRNRTYLTETIARDIFFHTTEYCGDTDQVVRRLIWVSRSLHQSE